MGKEVSLSSEVLCGYLEKAEALRKAEWSGLRHSIEPGVQKQKQPITPTEEVASSDEATFRVREENAVNEAEQDGLSHKAISERS